MNMKKLIEACVKEAEKWTDEDIKSMIEDVNSVPDEKYAIAIEENPWIIKLPND